MGREGERVMIVGGTGFLGYHAALEFLKRGYQVSSLAIPDVDLEGWYPSDINILEGDVFTMSSEELKDCFRGYDAMVYAIGPDDRTTPEAPAREFFKEKMVDTSIRVFEAAGDVGVKRAVLLGSYLHYFHRELPHLNLAQHHPYIWARIEQAEAVIRVSECRMETMILELPYIFGSMPNRIPLWKEVFFDRLLKMNPILYPDGGSTMVCVESVAEAIVGAVELGEHGKMYPVGDQNLRWKEMFSIMFTSIGIQRRFIHVPYWMAEPVGHYMMWKENRRSKEPGLHLAYVFKDILSQEFYLDSRQSAENLGYGCCDVKAAIAKTAEACYPEGYGK